MAKSKAIKPGYLFTPGYSNYVFSLLFLLYLFDYADRMIIGALVPYIQADWGIDDAQIPMLSSVVYWTIVALTLPLSALVDRWSRRKTIGAMATIWSLATAACAFTGSFGGLMVARGFVGSGEAGYAPGGSAMISAMYPKEKRSWIMGLWNASIPLGAAIGVAVGGIIAANWGWKSAFGLVAAPGLIIAILFFFVKDYKTVPLYTGRVEAATPKRVKMGFKELAKEFLSKPALLFTYFGFTGVVFVTTSVLFWLPSYFERMYDLPMEKAAPKASLVMLLAIIGAPLGGYLTDRWRKKRINARLLFPAITTIIAALLCFLSFTIFVDIQQYIILLAMGMTITAFIPGAAATTQDLVHPGLRATSFALSVFIQNLIGASLGPIVIGHIARKTDLATAMKTLPIFLIISAVLFLLGSFYYKKDLAKVEDVKLEVKE
ncbi:MAG: MFS transporter [Bacteroidales bacterium]|nr:MFS transporter [Bacteroidales bacterium]